MKKKLYRGEFVFSDSFQFFVKDIDRRQNFVQFVYKGVDYSIPLGATSIFGGKCFGFSKNDGCVSINQYEDSKRKHETYRLFYGENRLRDTDVFVSGIPSDPESIAIQVGGNVAVLPNDRIMVINLTRWKLFYGENGGWYFYPLDESLEDGCSHEDIKGMQARAYVS